MTTDDDLLCALDQLTNTVYWCRQRGIPITAGSAILEAVGDWLDSHDPTGDDDVPSVTAGDADGDDPIGVAFDRLGRHIHTQEPNQARQSVTGAFAERAQPLERGRRCRAPPVRAVREQRPPRSLSGAESPAPLVPPGPFAAAFRATARTPIIGRVERAPLREPGLAPARGPDPVLVTDGSTSPRPG